MEIEIICHADDAQRFNDVLHFVIKEGVDIDINLRAKGIGPTIWCKESLENVNFGTQYTHRSQAREIFVENKGRKAQKLSWVKKKPFEKKAQGKEDDKAVSKTL